jgi:hypothetical protein
MTRCELHTQYGIWHVYCEGTLIYGTINLHNEEIDVFYDLTKQKLFGLGDAIKRRGRHIYEGSRFYDRAKNLPQNIYDKLHKYFVVDNPLEACK